jgi:manganese ABC transport system, solute-binding protein
VDSGPREQIVRATGAKDGGILYVDSLSDQDGPVPTYLDLIRYDADAISKGLTS